MQPRPPTPWPGTPSSLELQHTDSAVAPVPCFPSKILTGQTQQCLREEEEAIRKLLAGTNPNFLCWPGCLLLPLQSAIAGQRGSKFCSCFLFLSTQEKSALHCVSTELNLPSLLPFFLLPFRPPPFLKQALQKTSSTFVKGGVVCVANT